MIGIGGAPTRATTLPTEAKERKAYPVASGVLDYFPDALAAIAHVSWKGNEQHNPGQPLHWARGKSADEADTMMRHFLERGTLDKDGVRHTAKMAWRALALLQKEIEAENSVSQEDQIGTGPGDVICVPLTTVTREVYKAIDDHRHESFVPAQKMGICQAFDERTLTPDDRYMS